MGWEKYLNKMNQQGKKVFPGVGMVKPHASNLYTGFQLNAGLAAGLTAGLIGWGVGKSIYNATANAGSDAAMANTEDVGALGRTTGDAVGQATGGKRNLGATGDLVFGMHNARKGD